MSAYDLGMNLFQQRKFAEAAEAFRQATLSEPNSSLAWLYLGISLQSLGRIVESLEAISKGLLIDPKNVQLWEKKGYGLLLRGEDREAIVACDMALALNPKLLDALYIKGRALCSYENNHTLLIAVATLDRALQINPNHVDALIYKAYALSILRKFNESIPPAHLAITLNPNYGMGWRILAIAHWNRREFSLGLDAINQALRIDPKDKHAWILKGAILRNAFTFSGDRMQITEALVAFNKAIALDPSDQVAKLGQIDALAALYSNRSLQSGGNNMTNFVAQAKSRIAWSNIFAIISAIFFVIRSITGIVAFIGQTNTDSSNISVNYVFLVVIFYLLLTPLSVYLIWSTYWGWVVIWRNSRQAISSSGCVGTTAFVFLFPFLFPFVISILLTIASFYGFFGGAIYHYRKSKQIVKAASFATNSTMTS